MSRLAAVLFDLDGTLLDTNALIIASFQHAFAQCLGRPANDDELHEFFGIPLLDAMLHYVGGDRARAEQMVTVYRTWNLAHHDEMAVAFPGVADGLARLSAAGMPMAVVTSKRVDLATRGLRINRLEQYFPVVIGQDLVSRHKPDPESCLLAVHRLGLTPGNHIVMVGDSVADLQAGRRAGLRTAAVEWSEVAYALLAAEQPDLWARSFGDLVEYTLEAPALGAAAD